MLDHLGPFNRWPASVRRGLGLLISTALGLLLAGAVLFVVQPSSAVRAQPPAAPAVSFTVNNVLDAPDIMHGDGVCETATNNNVCTLRAAVQELDAQPAGGSITLPSGTYNLTDDAAGDLQLQTDITLTGAGPALSIVQGNPAGWAHRILRVQSGANALVSGVTISGGHPVAVVGGGINVVSGTLALNNSVVRNSSAITGGGLYAAVAISLNGVTVRGNTAVNDGGGLYAGADLVATDSVFQHNAVTNAPYLLGGGGLHAVGAFNGTNVSFLTNTVNSFFGFGSGLLADGPLTLNGGQFVGNGYTGLVFGGGLHANGPVTISGTQFANNTAEWGGGADITDFSIAPHSLLTNATFISNSALNGGGGGLVTWYTATLSGVNFYSNSASVHGGGAYTGIFTNVVVALQGGALVNNTALAGGGLFSDGSLTVAGTQFLSNTATSGDGGGLDAGGDLVATNAVFNWNRAPAGSGGGSSAGELAPISHVTLGNVQYLSNSAIFAGGGAFISGTATIAATNSQFLSNTAYLGGGLSTLFGSCSVSGGGFVGNAAVSGGWGGGIYCAGPTLSISGTQFLTNTADFIAGSALGNTAWLTNTIISGNSSGGYAGGLQTYGPTRISGSLFQLNQAAANGGGLSTVGSVWISNSTFISNTAHGDGTNGGGAVSANQSITATGSHFTANTADTSPGGALVSDGGLYLDHSDFTGNVAALGDGGAAVARGGSTLDHATFSGNHSALNGGALAITGTLAVSSTLVTGNSAGSGGGLYQYAGDGRIVNSLFAGNTAGTAGMQLYLAPTGTLQILFDTVGAPSLLLGDAIRIAGGNVQVYDTIVTQHAVGLRRLGGTLTQDYNLLFGNTTPIVGGSLGGTNNVSGDPLFANPAAGDYHLRSGSAAIDAGQDVGVATDADDQPRPFGAGFDIGYDEFTLRRLLLPFITR